jgi:signal peptidase I
VNSPDVPKYVPADHLAPETLKVVAELLSQTGEEYYIPLHGNSMLPLLRDGDQLLVTPRIDEIRLGDIVVFQRDGEWVSHRVLRVEEGGTNGLSLHTKGDRVIRPDKPFSVNLLVGKVLAVRRAGKQMQLDTRGWRQVGKILVGMMMVEVGLYGKAAGKAGSDRENRRGVIIISRGMQLFNSLLFRTIQALVGR